MTNIDRIAILCEHWGSNTIESLLAAMIADKVGEPMPLVVFLDNCTVCNNDFGETLLTGIAKLWPHVWEVIPKKRGIYAWECLCDTIILCGVQLED